MIIYHLHIVNKKNVPRSGHLSLKPSCQGNHLPIPEDDGDDGDDEDGGDDVDCGDDGDDGDDDEGDHLSVPDQGGLGS